MENTIMSYQELTGFGIKNFRIFKEYQEFEFRPLTILTGPNNSGKSSLIKAILLAKQNWSNEEISVNPPRANDKLNFAGETHNLGSHSLVLNDPEKPLKFLFRYGKYAYCFEFDSEERLIYDYQLCRKNDEVVIQQKGGDLRVDLELFKEYIDDLFAQDYGILFEFYPILQALENSINSGNIFIAINTAIDKNGKLIISFCKDKAKFGNFKYYEKFTEASLLNNKKLVKKKQAIERVVNSTHRDKYAPDLKITFINFLKLFLKVENFEFEEEMICKLIPGLTGNFINLPFSFLSSIKGPQKRYFGINDSSEFANLFKTMIEKLLKDEQEIKKVMSKYPEELARDDGMYDPIYKGVDNFFNKWISNFNIGYDITYGYDEIKEAYYFNIDGRALPDHGYGVTQIISFIFWLSSKFFSSDYLVLEEPESNLHPKFQSILAEMIAETAKQKNCCFIIETHSEYMIRKFQYLVAKGEIKAEDIVIYYFNDQEEVAKGAEQVKELHIREDGMMDGDFGPGFFDESTRLTVDLLKLQNKN
jgi:predicted ATPase